MSLTIQSAQILLVQVPLRFSVEHALASRRENTTGFLILTAKDGTKGVGEFLARDYVMGETREQIVSQLENLSHLLLSAPIENPIEFLSSLWDQPDAGAGRIGAIGAVDLALLDGWSKQCRVPLSVLLSPGIHEHSDAPTFSAVYPFASGIKLTVLNACYARLLQMHDVKVKGTGDIEGDLNYVRRIRRAFPYPVRVRMDLNGSLSAQNAQAYLERMVQAQVRWFEQPFPKTDWEASARFQTTFRDQVVLCADESVCSSDDLERTIREKAFRAINIRIGKNGGLVRSLQLYNRAVAAGLKVQLGALVGETSVLAYAGMHFAAATAPLEHYEGCFGKYLLKWDPVSPSLTFSRFGRVPFDRLPQAGLVPALDLERLEKNALWSERLE